MNTRRHTSLLHQSLLAIAMLTLGGNALAQGAASTCVVVPSMEVNVGTPVEGVLETVTVDRGALVQQGQLLARLEASVEAAAVSYSVAKAEFGNRKRQRNEELRRQQLISDQELDEIETERRLSELELRERQEHLRLRSIHSPIRGVVVERYRNRGDLVSRERIFRIAQLDPLHVEVVVPASLFGKVQNGQKRQVRLELLNISLPATVSTVDRVIDPASGTFRVRLALPNPKHEIPSGLRCSVDF